MRPSTSYISIIVCGILGAIFSLVADADATSFPLRWRYSNPAPHGADIVDSAWTSGCAVQVGERGQIFTSSDFLHWIPRDSHTNVFLRGVTFFGGRIVICGENGTVLFADDPAEFYYQNLGTTDWLESVAASTNLVVLVGDNGAIYSSTNAVNWTRKTVPFTSWLRGVAWGPPGFVAVGENGLIANSLSGNTWNVRPAVTTRHLNRIRIANHG